MQRLLGRKPSKKALDAKTALDADLEIAAERLAVEEKEDPPTPTAARGGALRYVPINVVRFSLTATPESRALCEAIGGLAAVRAFTSRFYEYAFQDPRLDKFLRERGPFHGERFANWISEKMGAGTPWTAERRTRSVCPFSAHGHEFESAHDRSSAHFAAWHSPKRDPEDWGKHFKLDDCRIWMRLHFLAARETGCFADAGAGAVFEDYYVRLIAHFVSVYERSAPPFAREAARWGRDRANIDAYVARGRTMPDVADTSPRALDALPADERVYTGSDARPKRWPYDDPNPGPGF